jgi:hypothetical protein
MDLAERIGTISEAHLYSADFITIDGATHNGKKFSVTLSMKEEENNGN